MRSVLGLLTNNSRGSADTPARASSDIEIAAPPETVEDGGEIRVALPLSAEPDELLLKELKASPPLSSLCDSFEVRGRTLLLHPNDGGLDAVKTMLTAVLALIETTNRTRADELMSEEERAAAELEQRREQVQDDVLAWWEEQGRVESA